MESWNPIWSRLDSNKENFQIDKELEIGIQIFVGIPIQIEFQLARLKKIGLEFDWTGIDSNSNFDSIEKLAVGSSNLFFIFIIYILFLKLKRVP